MKTDFLAKDVRKILGISQTLLSQWIAEGLIRPSSPGIGSGSRNIFNFEDVCRARLFQVMIEAKLVRKRASEFAFPVKHDSVQKAITKLISTYASYAAYATDAHNWESGKPVEESETSPNPAFLFLSKSVGDNINVSICENREEFARMYSRKPEIKLCHVINLLSIVEEVTALSNKEKAIFL